LSNTRDWYEVCIIKSCTAGCQCTGHKCDKMSIGFDALTQTSVVTAKMYSWLKRQIIVHKRKDIYVFIGKIFVGNAPDSHLVKIAYQQLSHFICNIIWPLFIHFFYVFFFFLGNIYICYKTLCPD